MNYTVAILAGGLATRLRPITEKIPKALVEVAGKPFILHQLEDLRRQGFTKVVLCLGYLGEQVENLLGNGAFMDLDIKYSWDGNPLLGTGGALKKALPMLDNHFFVYYGDSFLPIDFAAVAKDFETKHKPALMTVLQNSNRWDTSNVLFQNGQIVEYNKQDPRQEMLFIDYGLGILSASLLGAMPDGQPFDLATLYHELSIKGLLSGFEVFERFYEIGSHKGLEETCAYFERKEK
jgi:NDP-sugar pyrophosphorylase family protein